MLDEYSSRFSIKAIVRNRTATANNGRSYGGVAFIFRKRSCNFENFPLHYPQGHEILATVGSITGVKGKVVCLAVYAPPNLATNESKQLLEYLSDVVGELKRKFENCTIFVAGDFNQWPAEELIQDHPELSEVARPEAIELLTERLLILADLLKRPEPFHHSRQKMAG